MPVRKGTHLTFDDRCEIEEMIKDACSFREIARHLSVSPTTISGEVRRNRTILPPRSGTTHSTPPESSTDLISKTPAQTAPPVTQLSFYELDDADFVFDDLVPFAAGTPSAASYPQSIPQSQNLSTPIGEVEGVFEASSSSDWRASNFSLTEDERATLLRLASASRASNLDVAPSAADCQRWSSASDSPAPTPCARRERAPYVCTNCPQRRGCELSKARYIATHAQKAHDERLSQAHTGIACPLTELKPMVEKVKRLLSQGQSIQAIWATHAHEFPVCERTFYNYVERGVMGLTNLSLPKKVKYAPHNEVRTVRSASPVGKLSDRSASVSGGLTFRSASNVERKSIYGRRYSDWCRLPFVDRLLTVQMDTVEGRRGNRQCILSLHFVRLFFQLYILLPEKSQECVAAALDRIERSCVADPVEESVSWDEQEDNNLATTVSGEMSPSAVAEGPLTSFKKLFPVILTDRGTEFVDYDLIERGVDGQRRTHVYYCDPIKPSQKGAAEKNHVELRKILPKGTDFDLLTEHEVAEITSHVNSYPRAGMASAPIVHAQVVLPRRLLDELGVRVISPDDVIMTPNLLANLRTRSSV